MIDEIEAVLKQRIIDADMPLAPYAWPNLDFVPPQDGSGFTAVTFIYADGTRLGLNGAREYRGSVMFVLARPLNEGTLASITLAKQVLAAFSEDTRLPLASGGHVRVTTEPSIRSGYKDGLYWRTPVMVPFQSIVNPPPAL